MSARYTRLSQTAPDDIEVVDRDPDDVDAMPLSPTRASHDDDVSKHSNRDVDEDVVPVDLEEADAHLGVARVQAAQRVYGPRSRWFLFIGLGLASYIYSLDGQTTYVYLAYAVSTFDKHTLISSVQTAEQIIIAVFKPVVAKFADVTARSTTYILVLLFYVVGYIVIASAHSINAIAAGMVLYAVGYTGLQLLTQIIIADITTLKWRGLVSGLTSAPFIINGFVGANIAADVLDGAGWRWGYGMFAILIPVSLAPLIITLTWAERKAKAMGLLEGAEAKAREEAAAAGGVGFLAKARDISSQMDLLGLLLLGASVALILIPLTLADTAKGGWKNASIIAMLVVGCILLPIFILWDTRFAARPVIAPRFVRNRAVVLASFIGFFDFISFYLTYTYLYSFIVIVEPWSTVDQTYFISTQSIALTVFGILAGFLMRATHRYKWVTIVGLAIRLLGVGLMIHSRGANGSAVELVFTQIIQGFGGGFAAICAQVGAQASVPHVDVAMVTAVVLLLTEIGGAVGTAIAGAIWSNTMPGKLEEYLPNLNATERAELFGSITLVAEYPIGDPTRNGVIHAYTDTMLVMVIAATAVSVIPFLISFALPDWYLGDKQNAVDDADLDGHRRVVSERVD